MFSACYSKLLDKGWIIVLKFIKCAEHRILWCHNKHMYYANGNLAIHNKYNDDINYEFPLYRVPINVRISFIYDMIDDDLLINFLYLIGCLTEFN